jgi:hypothetical protein
VAAAVAAVTVGCGSVKTPAPSAFVAFESKVWGFKLEYPGDWEARAGKGAEPLILELRAPGHEKTVGAGVSVVGAWSAAPLEVVASSFRRKIAGAGGVSSSEVEVGGRPGKAFEYFATRRGERVWTRVVIARGNERYYFITFAAYEPQRETARPYFDAIERSIEIY